MAGDLNGDGTDPASSTIDEHSLAWLEVAHVQQSAHGCRAGGGQAGGLSQRNTFRQRGQHRFGRDAILRVGAVEPLPLPRRAEHAIADLEPRHAFADGIHGAGQVEAENERELICDIFGQHAPARLPVSGIDAGIGDPDPDFAGIRLGCRQLAETKRLRPAKIPDHHRVHHSLPLSFIRWPSVMANMSMRLMSVVIQTDYTSCFAILWCEADVRRRPYPHTRCRCGHPRS